MICDPRANCDQFSGPRVFDLFDFLCFQNQFVVGCPVARAELVQLIRHSIVLGCPVRRSSNGRQAAPGRLGTRGPSEEKTSHRDSLPLSCGRPMRAA